MNGHYDTIGRVVFGPLPAATPIPVPTYDVARVVRVMPVTLDEDELLARLIEKIRENKNGSAEQLRKALGLS